MSLLGVTACINNSENEKKRYLFYLHGMIVEDQGASAVHPEYGPYQYDMILETFRKEGFEVRSEIRDKGTDVIKYAENVTKEIQRLMEEGIPPEQITVLGASKGAIIAMFVSGKLGNDKVNFVFMAGCNEWVADNYSLNLCGNILSIYESSDTIGKSCKDILNKSSCKPLYIEVELNTGKKHGFIFTPMPDWVNPAIQWAMNREIKE
jgi:hypothetical protein